MKFEISEEMRKKILANVIIVAIAITIYFAYYKIDLLIHVLQTILSLLTPFILGFAIAFLLNRPMLKIESMFSKTNLKSQTKRNLSAIIAVILGIIVVGAFIALLVPQLFASAYTLVKDFPGYVDSFQKFALALVNEYAIDTKQITDFITKTDFFANITKYVTEALPEIARTTFQLGSILLNILLGVMSALYMLMDKERLTRYVKKINYAIFPTDVSNYFHRMAITSADIFNDFIIGKAIDSLIIGILCYIGLLILDIPYALLLAVIVGITNMIPVFGPFIGAVPGILILIMINPIAALYFALFIFALQQFDGNILGPLILGDKLGMPSIGILFSVCVGGGLFGVVGMFIGVPCFAVIYAAVKEFVNYRLQKKNIDIMDKSVEMKELAFSRQEKEKVKE